MHSNKFERIWVWLAAVLVLGLLLPNHYSPWLSVHQELTAAIAFAPLLAYAAVQGNFVPPLARGAFLLAALPLLQWGLGQQLYATDAWMASLYVVGFALAVHAGSFLLRPAADRGAQNLSPFAVLVPLWTALLLAATVSVGLAAHQWLIPVYEGIYVVEIPPGARPFANLAQPNQLATLLLLGLGSLLAVWQAGRVRTRLAFLLALWLVFGLAMTGSRSVVLTLLWLSPLFLLMRRRCGLRLAPRAFFVLVAAYFAFGWIWTIASEALLLATPGTTVLDRMGAPGVRATFWLQMVDAVLQRPWLGWGWGQIGLAQTATALQHPATHVFFESAHNVFLDIALWAGLPAAFLVLAGLAFWACRRIRAMRDPFSWICFVSVGFVFSHAMVEYPLYYAYFLLPTGVFMGALTDAGPRAQRKAGPPRCRLFVAAIAAMAGLLFVRVAWEYFPFEADWQLMRFQEARIGNIEPTEPPPALVLTGLHDFLRWSRAKPAPGMLAQDIEHMREISERYAYAAPMYRLAMAQALNGQAPAARDTLARLCRMQSKKACSAARSEWVLKDSLDFPQLKDVPFPPDP